MKTRTVALIAVSMLALTLAGCGLRGDLERPAPMWGSPAPDPADPTAAAPPDPNAPVPIETPDAR